MIKQTIFPRITGPIPAITKSYRWNGGTATVQLGSLGNYEMIVNGSRFSSQENSAKRDADYKPTVAEVSQKMVAEFEKRDAEFTSMHKKAPRLQTLSEHQKAVEALAPERYQRDGFSLSRPTRNDVRKELEEEANIRFADLYDDKRKEKTAFVNEHEKEALAKRMKGYEEVQAFFEDLQDVKETRINAIHQKEYERKRKEIEDYIQGEEKMTEQKIRAILSEINLPFGLEVEVEYTKDKGLLEVEMELFWDMDLPTKKASILSSGRISVKDKLVKEIEQHRTETILSLVYYIAASLFNVSINIQTQRLKLWLEGKQEGLLWIQFNRTQFARRSIRSVTPILHYYDWPRVDALRVIRGATQFDRIDAASFENAIAQTIVENGLEEIQNSENPAPVVKGNMAYISFEDAKLITDHFVDEDLIIAINKAKDTNASTVEVDRKYIGILKEIKG